MLKQILQPLLIITVILVAGIAHFSKLDSIPHGFQIDEPTVGVTLGCMADNGLSPSGDTHYPLFAHNGFSSPIPPTYIYPGMLWAKVFGISQGSLRGLSVTFFMIGVLGLFAIGRHLGGITSGLWYAAAASISPWLWPLTRVSWESTSALPFMIWGIFFCLVSKRWWHFMIAGILLAASAYTYPPLRLHIPFLLFMLAGYGLWQWRWKLNNAIVLGASAFITVIPLIQQLLSQRIYADHMNRVSIANPEYLDKIGASHSWLGVLTAAWHNFILYFSPKYLFFKSATENLTLTTGAFGIMSFLDMTAVIAALMLITIAIYNKKFSFSPATLPWLLFLGINILIGLIPGIITNTDNPHPLRTISAWPFAMMATGFIIHKTTQRLKWAGWLAIIITVIFTAVFLKDYFEKFPQRTQGWFSVWMDEEARRAKTDSDWMNFLYRYHNHIYVSRYYLMRYRGMGCVESQTTWNNLYPLFEKIAAEQNKK